MLASSFAEKKYKNPFIQIKKNSIIQHSSFFIVLKKNDYNAKQNKNQKIENQIKIPLFILSSLLTFLQHFGPHIFL